MIENLRGELSARRLLQDGLVFNTALGVLILGSLAWKPEIWINDYPPDIKEKYGEPPAAIKKWGYVVAVPFFLLLIGGIIWSTLRLKNGNGGRLSYQAAFTHITCLILSGWLVDLTLYDWLLFVTITPRWVVIPGTEGMAGYDDYLFHLKEHMRAFPFLIIGAAVLAFLLATKR